MFAYFVWYIWYLYFISAVHFYYIYFFVTVKLCQWYGGRPFWHRNAKCDIL